MSVTELRKMSQADLEKQLDASLKELFSLRIQKGSGQLAQPHLIRAARKRIAQLKTLISKKI